MKLLLREDVSGLGRAGDLVEVADGFARNYLLPKGVVYIATPENEKRIQAERKRRRLREQVRLESLRELAGRLSEGTVTIQARANEEQKLFGSVGPEEIARAVRAEHEAAVEPEHVVMEEAIKQLGVYDVALRFAPDIEATLKVWVVPAD